jgi:hypothetical protein
LLGIRANVVQIQQPKNIGLPYCDIVRHTVKNLQIFATTIAILTSEKSELSTLMNRAFNSRGPKLNCNGRFPGSGRARRYDQRRVLIHCARLSFTHACRVLVLSNTEI